MQNATRKICEAVFNHVTKESVLKDIPETPCPDSFFRCVDVPADGLCGWHGLLAAFNIKKFEAVPRQPSGYATNHTMQEQEVFAAKQFHMKTCEDALKSIHDKFQASILRVKDNPAFDPSDLEWISQVIGTSIRVTCCPEASELCDTVKLKLVLTIFYVRDVLSVRMGRGGHAHFNTDQIVCKLLLSYLGRCICMFMHVQIHQSIYTSYIYIHTRIYRNICKYKMINTPPLPLHAVPTLHRLGM